jgi:multidrug efflux pump subunit AcrA (membrane-fusion protein)
MHSTQPKIHICTRAVSLLLTAAVLTVLASACRKSQPAAIAVNVQTAQPTRGPIDRRITLPATIAPYEEATLYAKVAGYLKSIPVDKGDVVKQGDLLADIEVPELLADRAKYAAEVQVAEIDYKRVQYAQKKAPDLVVPQTVDDAKAKLDVARAEQERPRSFYPRRYYGERSAKRSASDPDGLRCRSCAGGDSRAGGAVYYRRFACERDSE